MRTRTTVEIDNEKLAAAARELGTTSKTDTIDAALALAAERGQEAERKVRSVWDFWGKDVSNPEVMKQARR
jgi:Arc/MetJ family transcription regulator